MASVIAETNYATARQVYERLRPQVETAANTGKLIVLDPDSGDFEIDDQGIESSHRLLRRHPDADLWAFRIGYTAVEALGGILERTASFGGGVSVQAADSTG